MTTDELPPRPEEHCLTCGSHVVCQEQSLWRDIAVQFAEGLMLQEIPSIDRAMDAYRAMAMGLEVGE